VTSCSHLFAPTLRPYCTLCPLSTLSRQLAINYALKSSTFNLILIVFSSVVIAAGQAMLLATWSLPPTPFHRAPCCMSSWFVPLQQAAGIICLLPVAKVCCSSYFKDIMQQRYENQDKSSWKRDKERETERERDKIYFNAICIYFAWLPLSHFSPFSSILALSLSLSHSLSISLGNKLRL